MSEEKINFGSKLGVISATVGSIVGLGNYSQAWGMDRANCLSLHYSNSLIN